MKKDNDSVPAAIYESDLRMARANARLEFAVKLMERFTANSRNQARSDLASVWASAARIVARMIDPPTTGKEDQS